MKSESSLPHGPGSSVAEYLLVQCGPSSFWRRICGTIRSLQLQKQHGTTGSPGTVRSSPQQLVTLLLS